MSVLDEAGKKDFPLSTRTSELLEKDDIYNKQNAIYKIIDEIYETVPKHIAGLHDTAESELGRWVNIASYVSDNIATQSDSAKVDQLGDIAKRARTAVRCIISNPQGDHHCAIEMRHEIIMDIYRVEDVMAHCLIERTNGSPAVTVVFGIITAAAVFIISMLIFIIAASVSHSLHGTNLETFATNTFGKLGPYLPWAVIAAFIGGAASVLMRLDSFEARRGVDPKLLFLNAAFKPYIGMIISFFVVAVQGLGIISVTGLNNPNGTLGPTAAFSLLVVGFLSGFSERFAKDFVGRTEETLSRGGGADRRASDNK